MGCSHSSHPFVVEHRELIHKIGVTGVKWTRIADADKDAAYLLADVDVRPPTSCTINRTRLENVLHRVVQPGGKSS